MNINIDRDGCISCGLCAASCPQVYRMGDDGPAEVFQQPASADESAAREAADACPVSVIHVT